MASKETLLFDPQDFDALDRLKPPPQVVGQLVAEHVIRGGSPDWWSVDYPLDPREFITLAEFKSRLEFVKYPKGSSPGFYLYPHPAVPVSIITLPIESQQLSFMVTARPYHPSSTNLIAGHDFRHVLFDEPISQIEQDLAMFNSTVIPTHCLPHLHGLIVGAREKQLFWYPFHWTPGDKFLAEIRHQLNLQKIDWILPTVERNDERSYYHPYYELARRKLIADHKPIRPDFPYTEVYLDDFLDYHQRDIDLMLYYPLSLPGIENVLPLAISTRTHAASSLHQPAVLGLWSGTGWDSKSVMSIWRFKNRELAQTISTHISRDFKCNVDTILFNPYGKPQYERIPPHILI